MLDAPSPSTYVAGFHDEFLIEKMTYRKFGNTSMIVSRLGISTDAFDTLEKFEPEMIVVIKETIRLALKGGVNFFDTSPYCGEGYGEELLGDLLKNFPRQAYYIATKVGRYSKSYDDMFDYSPKRIKDSIQNSLEQLNVEYIDLLTIQDIEFIQDLPINIKHIMTTLNIFKKQKFIRYIGISAYSIDKIKEFITLAGPGQINVVICNTRLTSFDNTFLGLLGFLAKDKIGIIAGQINAKGLLTSDKTENESMSSRVTNRDFKIRTSSAVLKGKDVRTDTEKMSTYYVAQCSEIDICLVEVLNPIQLKIHYDAVLHPLKPYEKTNYKYFKEENLKKRLHWEDTDLQMYNHWLLSRVRITDAPDHRRETVTRDASKLTKDGSKSLSKTVIIQKNTSENIPKLDTSEKSRETSIPNLKK